MCFAITTFFFYYWGGENRSLYRGLLLKSICPHGIPAVSRMKMVLAKLVRSRRPDIGFVLDCVADYRAYIYSVHMGL